MAASEQDARQVMKGKAAIVTGANRGVGKGIAKGLGEAGATVYVTGRTEDGGVLPEFLKETSIYKYKTAYEVTALDGLGVAYKYDHPEDDEVEKLFEHVMAEQGKLDIWVNNAWGGGIHAMQGYFFNTPFGNNPYRCGRTTLPWACGQIMSPAGLPPIS